MRSMGPQRAAMLQDNGLPMAHVSMETRKSRAHSSRLESPIFSGRDDLAYQMCNEQRPCRKILWESPGACQICEGPSGAALGDAHAGVAREVAAF